MDYSFLSYFYHEYYQILQSVGSLWVTLPHEVHDRLQQRAERGYASALWGERKPLMGEAGQILPPRETSGSSAIIVE